MWRDFPGWKSTLPPTATLMEEGDGKEGEKIWVNDLHFAMEDCRFGKESFLTKQNPLTAILILVLQVG